MTNLYDFAEDNASLKAAILALRNDFEAHIHDGISSRSFETLRAEAISARSFSIRKTFYTDDTAGFWAGLVSNTPKIYIGNASNFFKWDGSAVTIKGDITAGSININNKFTVSSAGAVVAKSYSLIAQYIAGEALTIGKLGCFINKDAVWGNDTGADKETGNILSAFTYVDQTNPTVATGEAPTQVRVGEGEYQAFGKIDLAGAPPGLPDWSEIESVRLRIYIEFTSNGAMGFTLYRLTSAFTESTITWNNKPADDNIGWAGMAVATGFLGEGMAAGANGLSVGYVEFDITELYRLWSSDAYTNNGFVIKASSINAGDSYLRFAGRTRNSVGSVLKLEPYLASVITVDNPGSGTSIIANDGKIYSASHNEYRRIKSIAGIIGATVSAGETIDVYSLADKSIIPSSVLAVTTGKVYYLTGIDGTIGTLANDIIESDKWDLKIGVGTPNGLMIDFDKKPVFIRATSVPGSVNPSEAVHPPPHARIAVVNAVYDTAVGSFRAFLTLEKSRLDNVVQQWDDKDAVNKNHKITVDWATGSSGKLQVTATDTDAITALSVTIYWYA